MKKAVKNKTLRGLLCCLSIFLLVLVLCPMLLVNAEEADAPESIDAAQVTQATEATDETQDTPAIQTVEVGIPVEEHPELFLPRSMPTHGEAKIAVFLIEFPDYKNDNSDATVEYYDRLYFNGGVNSVWGEISVAEFYRQESYGKLNISGQVFDWYTAEHERTYYDDRKEELVTEVGEYYRAQGVNFADFDGNGDGAIDSIVYHFAGDDTQYMDSPWYGGLCMNWGGEIGDMKFFNMIQIKENASKNIETNMIQVACHELMHTLGMPDLYSNMCLALFPTNDLMAENERTINPYTKIMLGWLDTVQVITGDVDNLRLDLYGGENTGGVAIVTDQFNGWFDEFYVVAYRAYRPYSYQYKLSKSAVIWHIDARLNENGTEFRYENLYYTPTPDIAPVAPTDYISPYPFIEELSSDPTCDFVLMRPLYLEQSAFHETSVLGPNSRPSSDTHDGRYTGIQIYQFEEHEDTYLTFSVSFVEDTMPPVVATKDDDLTFTSEVKVHFNEFIYVGENWDDILVTDLKGNPLDATIALSYYPRFELQVTFKTTAYEDGYRLVFPEGALQDSSGNRMAAKTLVASNAGYLFPTDQKFLPGVGEYERDNSFSYVYFFNDKDDLVVITQCYGARATGFVRNAKIEIMRLNSEGNVLDQRFFDNPYYDDPNSCAYISEVIRTEDGCYIAFCPNERGCFDRLFCFDGDGNVLWVNDEYYNSGDYFVPGCNYTYKNGIIACFFEKEVGGSSAVYISSNGDIAPISMSYNNILILENGKLLFNDGTFSGNNEIPVYTQIQIKDHETLEVEAQGRLDGEWLIKQAQVNDDGSMIIFCENFLDSKKVFLLDAALNVIKSVELEKANTGISGINWFTNDGFCEIFNAERADLGGNERYHVRRFDRFLNLIWEADIESNFIHYFKSSTGELWAYKSMMAPERVCYIEYYGSEDAYKTEHAHNIVYKEEVPASCFESGEKACWHCPDCGCIYADSEGQILITNASVLMIPSFGGHNYVADEYVAPTCTQTGLTEGYRCGGCGDVLVEQTLIDAWGHYEVIDYASEPTCTTDGLTEGTHCSVCNEILIAQETIAALGHTSADAVEVNRFEPTCTQVGGYDMVVYCVVCGDELSREHTVIDAPGHTEVVDEAIAATCTETGLTEGKHCSVCNEVLVAQETVSALGHTYSDWITVVEPTATEEGVREKTCATCGDKITEAIPATGEETTLADTTAEDTTIEDATTEVETSNPEITDPATKEEETNTESKGGCGGVVGVGAIFAILTLGVCVVAKKKD